MARTYLEGMLRPGTRDLHGRGYYGGAGGRNSTLGPSLEFRLEFVA